MSHGLLNLKSATRAFVTCVAGAAIALAALCPANHLIDGMTGMSRLASQAIIVGTMFGCCFTVALSWLRKKSELEQRLRLRAESETALRQTEQQLLALINNIPGVTYRCEGEDGWFLTFASDSIADLTGYPKSDFIRNAVRSFADVIHPDDLKGVNSTIDAAIARGEPYDHSYRVVHASGAVRWVRERGRGVFNDAGDFVCLDGVIFDITADRAARLQLRDSESLLSTIINILPQRIFWKDAHGLYLGANRAFLADAGQGSIDGLTDQDMPWQGDFADLIRVLDQRVMETGRPELDIVEPHIRNDGSVCWLTTCRVPIRNARGDVVGILGTYSDITAAKEAEQQLCEARDSAEAANRAKSEFLANMSHEIRTPMTSILGYAELLTQEDSDTTPQMRAEYANIINSNGRHLLSIINDILDLSKIEAGKLTFESVAVSPARLVEDVVSLLLPRATGKGIRLELNYPTPVPRAISADPLRLRQILMNLVGNAVKFTDAGRVLINVSLHAQSHFPTLVFDIEDTGIGMSPEQVESVFNAFHQADTSTTRRFGGTGLGLHISKRLAQMLGGDIQVESKQGHGSTFTLTLPIDSLEGRDVVTPDSITLRHVEVSTQPAPTMVGSVGQSLAGRRILFAEDGPDNQRLISFILRKAGASVTCVPNGRAAIEALTVSGHTTGPVHDSPPFDLIIMDMQMPEMDGYTAVRLLREKGCAVPIIALTAHAMNSDESQCLAVGCDAFASKPIERRQLIEIARTAIERGHVRV